MEMSTARALMSYEEIHQPSAEGHPDEELSNGEDIYDNEEHQPASLGNIVAETLLQMKMFPRLAARETRCRSKKMFLNQVKNIFASQTEILLPKLMFPSLATQEDMSGNNVSATMFPALAKALRAQCEVLCS